MDIHKEYRWPAPFRWLGWALLILFLGTAALVIARDAYRSDLGPLALDKAVAAYRAVDDWSAANRAWIKCWLACPKCTPT